MKRDKVVITGGAGFVGSHLSEKLLSLGYDVHIIDNLIAGKKSNIPFGAQFYKLDICNYEKIKTIFRKAKYVFHLAALPSVEFSIHNPLVANDTNVTGTLNVFKASSDASVKKVIFASSCSVYGDQKNIKLNEKLIPNPISPYALQKRIGEQYASLFYKLYALNVLCLRFFNIYGPRQKDSGPYAFVIAKFLKAKSEGKSLNITGTGKQTRDFVFIDDVVDACVKGMTSVTAPGDIINIGGGKGTSINRIAKVIGGHVNRIPARIEPKDAKSDNGKAFTILGWKPKTSLINGIKKLQIN